MCGRRFSLPLEPQSFIHILCGASPLQSENARLKMEITELKALFLAHKSCQVTKKQMEDGLLDSCKSPDTTEV